MKSHAKPTLPTKGVRSPPPSDRSVRHLRKVVAPSPGSPRSSPRILLADDDASVRGSLSGVLISEGYIVIPAHDGQHALELAASVQLDLVLLDLNMPVKNGWDTFEELTRDHALLPVIIITARPNQLFTAIGAGVGALLEKPMEISILLLNIQRLLAESVETRLARIAGKKANFHYSAAHPSADKVR